MRDKVLFMLPDSLEMRLAALSAIQDFERCAINNSKMGLGIGVPEFSYYCNCTDDSIWLDVWMPELVPTFPKGQWLVHHKQLPLRGEYDLVHKFDAEDAYLLGKSTGMHVTQAFSVQIGSLGGVFPKLSPVQLSNDYVLVIRDNDKDFYSLLRYLPNEEIRSVTVLESKHVMPVHIQQASMVVGMRSGFTYYAAILGKAVYELYPDDRHRNWLSKWKNPLYRMHYGYENCELHNRLMVQRIKQLWESTKDSLVTANRVSKTPMEQSTSIAHPAGG